MTVPNTSSPMDIVMFDRREKLESALFECVRKEIELKPNANVPVTSSSDRLIVLLISIRCTYAMSCPIGNAVQSRAIWSI